MADRPNLRLVQDGDGAPFEAFKVDTISLVMVDGNNRIFHNGKQLQDVNHLRQCFYQLLDQHILQQQQPEIAETFTFIRTPQKTIVLQHDRVIDQFQLFIELDRIMREGNRLRRERAENELASTPRGML